MKNYYQIDFFMHFIDLHWVIHHYKYLRHLRKIHFE